MEKKAKKEIRPLQVVNFDDDLSEIVERKQNVIIYVEHSNSSVKRITLRKYLNQKYNMRADKFIVVQKQFDSIPVSKMSPEEVLKILTDDLKFTYNELLTRYPSIRIEKGITFNFALCFSHKSKKGEFFNLALMLIDDKYIRQQISPIITIDEKTYNMLIGKDKSKEGKLLYDIMQEKTIGYENFGIPGYISNGKYMASNLYLETLLDIIPEYRGERKLRSKALKYAKQKSTKDKYVKNLNKKIAYETNKKMKEEEEELITDL